jgi:hypothetical protein
MTLGLCASLGDSVLEVFGFHRRGFLKAQPKNPQHPSALKAARPYERHRFLSSRIAPEQISASGKSGCGQRVGLPQID